MFCGPETTDVSRGGAEGNIGVEGPQNILLSEVTVNKCFVIYQPSKNQKQNVATVNIFIRNSLKTFQQTNLFSHKVF